MLLGSVADMRRAQRVHDPPALLAMRDKRADADDRMVDVLRKLVADLVADRFAHFIIGARTHAVCCGVTAQIGHSLEVPDNDVAVHGWNFAYGEAWEKPGLATNRANR